jgi:multidrug efflux pump subunit AcrA (membrane-fusion protein)
MSARGRRIRFWVGLAVLLLVLGGAGAGIYKLRGVQAAATFPMAPARKGDFLVIVRCRGELRARRSVQITAPVNVPQLRIVWLAPPGEQVKAGDPVIRFDPSSARQQLQEKEASLKQAQATLEQAGAQARIMAEQDKRDLAAARYAVERAKLEASKVEIVSRLQGEESRIDLATAEQKLKVQEATTQLHEASNKAKIASLTRQLEQAQAEVALTKERLAKMELKSPSAGIIVYMSNFSQGWMNAKPFKVGDQAWPGGGLAEIPDLNSLEMSGKVEEIDRGRIAQGNSVNVRVDALPELTLPAKLELISPLTEQSFEWPPTRSFKGYAQLAKSDPRLRPGMNGSMDVVVSRLPGAISIPSKAVFTRHGKPTVFVVERGRSRPVEIKVEARNPDEVAVSGLAPGAMVALVDVERKERKQ